MCGIYGILSTEENLPERSVVLESLSRRLIHRGPDKDGFIKLPEIAMGTRRLAIISTNGNEQPVRNEDGQVWAVMNGEIYNYRELRSDLIKRHDFLQEGDAEVIVHLYEELGEGFAAALEGMFAVALWDARKKVLILTRDRLGEKPLYTWQNETTFVFASELQSISHLPFVRSELDIRSAVRFISCGYVPGPQTILKSIEKIPSATFRVIDCALNRYTKSYWEIPEPDSTLGLDENGWLNLLEHTLRTTCVRQYQAADLPPAVYLSGGLDSSLISTFLAESGYDFNAFTIFYPDEPITADSVYAAQLTKRLGIKQIPVLLTNQLLLDGFSAMIRYSDEPCADPSSLPIFLLSAVASRSFRVAFTGGGADELFAGYPEHLSIAKDIRQQIRPRFIPNPLFFDTALLSNELTRSLYVPQVLAQFQNEGHPGWSQVWDTPPPFMVDPLWYVLSTDLKQRLPDMRLAFSDRMTMANSLEVRSPFLDVQVLNVAMRMPSHFKIDEKGGKRPLRLLASRHLPRALAQRPKEGLRNPMFDREYLKIVLPIWENLKYELPVEFKSLFARGIIETTQLHAIESEQWKPRQLLWRFIVLAAWLKEFLHQTEATDINA